MPKRAAKGTTAVVATSLGHLPAEQLYRIADFLNLSDVLNFTLALGKRAGVPLRAALAEVTELKRAARTRRSTPAQIYARWAALPQPLLGALATLSQEMLLPIWKGAALSGSALELSRFETLALRHAVRTTNAGERALRARQTARDCRERLAIIQRCIDGDTGLAAAWRRVGGDEVFGRLLSETLSDVTLRSKLLGVYGTLLEEVEAAFKRRAPTFDNAARVWLGRHSAHPVVVFGATAHCSASMAFSHLILGGVAAREPSGDRALRIGDSCDVARTLERVLDQPFTAIAAPSLGGGGTSNGAPPPPPSRVSRRRGGGKSAELADGVALPNAAPGGARVGGALAAAAQCDQCAAVCAMCAHCRVCRYSLCAQCMPATGRHRCDPKCDVSNDADVTEILALRMMSFASMMRREVDTIADDERLAVNRALISAAQAQRDWLATVEAGRADADAALAKSSDAHAAYVRTTYSIADPFQSMGDAPSASSGLERALSAR
ncbi:hypothetical protein KFE25_006009 [Diacronema lutheri]|uniref:Uncharacterized protein n=2 Tax=Diacronema lutheri TaxID=2081491 RepID=A0A8J6CED7_DIALT|nr:hypothetical protein KFE25_006009 [Diacronema lutheri]